jgi:hypothetical protein
MDPSRCYVRTATSFELWSSWKRWTQASEKLLWSKRMLDRKPLFPKPFGIAYLFVLFRFYAHSTQTGIARKDLTFSWDPKLEAMTVRMWLLGDELKTALKCVDGVEPCTVQCVCSIVSDGVLAVKRFVQYCLTFTVWLIRHTLTKIWKKKKKKKKKKQKGGLLEPNRRSVGTRAGLIGFKDRAPGMPSGGVRKE